MFFGLSRGITGVAASVPTEPPATANLVATFYASEATAGATFTWPNAYGTDATQSTAAQQPTITTDATIGDVVRFDGSDDNLVFTGVTSNSSAAHTQFMIFDQKSTAANQVILGMGAGPHNIDVGGNGSSALLWDGVADRTLWSTSTGTRVQTLVCDGTSYTPYTLRVADTGGTKISRVLGGLCYIGQNYVGAERAEVDIGCLMIWDKALTAGELTQLWDWAKATWPSVGL